MVTGEKPYEIDEGVEFRDAVVAATWNEDAAGIGSSVAELLTEAMAGEEFGRLDPSEFYPLIGVTIEDDVAQFPECRFFQCDDRLALFVSNPPRMEWHRFFDSLCDVAHDICHVRELYVVGGMVTIAPHTWPRGMLAIANTPEMKDVLRQYGLASDVQYETPPGQRPTLNSYLLWVARNRGINAATLWVPVPFYLSSHEDPKAVKRLAEFFELRLDLGLDFAPLNEEIIQQDELIAEARSALPEVDVYIRRLESNDSLTEDESERLVKELDEFLWAHE